MKYVLVLLVSFGLFGCATPPTVVSSLLGKSEAMVSIGATPLEKGDGIQLLKQECREVSRRDSVSFRCSKRIVGSGVVDNVTPLNEAVIRANGDLALERGLIVEKVKQ